MYGVLCGLGLCGLCGLSGVSILVCGFLWLFRVLVLLYGVFLVCAL